MDSCSLINIVVNIDSIKSIDDIASVLHDEIMALEDDDKKAKAIKDWYNKLNEEDKNKIREIAGQDDNLSGFKTDDDILEHVQLLIEQGSNDDPDVNPLTENETDQEKEDQLKRIKSNFDKEIKDDERRFFGNDTLPLSTFRGIFRENVFSAFLFCNKGNNRHITYTTRDFNIGLMQLKQRKCQQLAKFLEARKVAGFDSKYSVFTLTSFSQNKFDNLLIEFDRYLLNNYKSADELLSKVNEDWRKYSDPNYKSEDDVDSLFVAVSAYLQLKHFDNLIGAELSRFISVDENRRGQESADLKTPDDSQLKYQLGNSHQSKKATFGQEFSDAMANIGKISQLFSESIPKYDILTQEKLGEKIKISDFGVAWNSLKKAINTLNNTATKVNKETLEEEEFKKYETIDDIKKAFSHLLECPNEFVQTILHSIENLSGQSKGKFSSGAIQLLIRNGCYLEQLNTLYSIALFLKKVIEIENNDIKNNPNNKTFERTGIHNYLKQDVIMNLLFQIAPANYLETNLSKDSVRTDYITKATSIRNRKNNHIDAMRAAMHKNTAFEHAYILDGRVEFLPLKDNPKNSSTQIRLSLKNGDRTYNFIVTALSGSGTNVSVFSTFEKVRIIRDLSNEELSSLHDAIQNLNENYQTNIEFSKQEEVTNGTLASRLNQVKEQLKTKRDQLRKQKEDVKAQEDAKAHTETINEINRILDLYLNDIGTSFSQQQLNSTAVERLKNNKADDELTNIRTSLLEFVGQMLDLPINTERGLQILSQVQRSRNNTTLNDFVANGIRVSAQRLLMQQYLQAQSEAENTQNYQYNNVVDFYKDRFNDSRTFSDNLRSWGTNDFTPDPIAKNESWVDAWYNSESIIAGTNYPATTKNAEKNNIANFRNTSLASSYLDIYAGIKQNPSHAAYNTLFARNTQAILSQGYDMQVITATGDKKLVKKLTQTELIYHQIAHNFFSGYLRTNVFNVQPTVYSDKIAFVLFQISRDAKYKIPGSDESKTIDQLTEDEYISLYQDTIGDYHERSFNGTKKQILTVLNYALDEGYIKGLENSDIRRLKAQNESDTGIIQKVLGLLTQEQFLNYVLEYNKQRPENERIIQLAQDADYRVTKNGKLSLVELAIEYSKYKEDKQLLRSRMRREMLNMVRDLIKYNVKFDFSSTSDLYAIAHEKGGLWRDGADFDEFIQKWRGVDGNIIYAYGKNEDGEDVAITSLSQLNKLSDVEINPIFKRYFYIENILSQNLRYSILGSEVADPDKVSGVDMSKDFAKGSTYYKKLQRAGFDNTEIEEISNGSVADLFLKAQPDYWYSPDMNLVELIPEQKKQQEDQKKRDEKKYNAIKEIKDEIADKIISSCEGAQYKRNVIMPATMINMSCNTINGLGTSTKVAIIEDTTAFAFNTKGQQKGYEAHDGGGIRTPQQADLENNSLGDQAAGNDLAKTIWHYYDPVTGKSFLAKWAVYTLTNVRMQDSADSTQQGLKLYKRMTNTIRWDGKYDLCNSRYITNQVEPVYDENGKQKLDKNGKPVMQYISKLDFSKDILIACDGGLYYQDRGETYRIDNFRNIDGVYITTETYQSGNDNIQTYCITLFDKDSNEIRLRAQSIDGYNTILKQAQDLIASKKYHTIGSNYELWQAMGGLYCVNSFTDNAISENSHHAVTAFMNNVYERIDPTIREDYNNKNRGVNQSRYRQPLKEAQIGYATNASTIKRVQYNINPASAWEGDTELNYAEIDNRFLGKQGDTDHEADESEVSEMIQVIASLDVGGETHLFAKQAFEALGRLTANGMKLQVEALSLALSKDSQIGKSKEQIASTIYHIIGQILFKNVKIGNDVGVGNTILRSIEKEFYKRGMNDHKLVENESTKKAIERFLPLSDPNVFSEMIKSITGELNDLALKRKYKGIGSVLVPGFNVMEMFHLHGAQSGLKFNDIVELALRRTNIKGITSSANAGLEITNEVEDGNNIQIKKKSYLTGQIKKEDGTIDKFGYSTISRSISNTITIRAEKVDNLTSTQKTNLLLAILNSLKVGQKVQFDNFSNDDLELIQTLGIEKNANDLYQYKPLSQYQYNKIIVHNFLKTEQERDVYWKDASYFQPEDSVSIYTENEQGERTLLTSIDFDQLHKYYDFKQLFVVQDRNKIREAIREKSKAENEEQLQEYIDDHFGEIIEKYYKGANKTGLQTYKNISQNPDFKADPFMEYFRYSLYENLKFQENITKPANLRPQRIQFQLSDGTYANIFDINESVALYVKNTKYYKFPISAGGKVLTNLSEEQLRLRILDSTRSLTYENENSTTVSVYGRSNLTVDKSTVDVQPAEALMSNIYASLFSQGNRSMYDIDTDFRPQRFSKINLAFADFQLCSTKNHLSFVLGKQNLDKSTTSKFKRVRIEEDYVYKTVDGQQVIEIWAVNEQTKQPIYKIGTFDNTEVEGIGYSQEQEGFVDKEGKLLNNQYLYAIYDGKIYKKKYYLTRYKAGINGRNEQFIQFHDMPIDDPVYRERVIKAIQADEGYQWLQLNGSLKRTNGKGDDSKTIDVSHLEDVKAMLGSLKQWYQNDLSEESFFTSIDQSNDFLEKLISNVQNNKDLAKTYIKLFGKQNGIDYEQILSDIQKKRSEYQKASYELSKFIISARIPAQSLQSYMAMRVVGFLPTNTNQVVVSHFQTWLQGSDYDIDKSYIMSYQFSQNGVFESWSPLFDYSSFKTLKASLDFDMPKNIKVISIAKDTAGFRSALDIDEDVRHIIDLTNEINRIDSKIESTSVGRVLVMHVGDVTLAKGRSITASIGDEQKATVKFSSQNKTYNITFTEDTTLDEKENIGFAIMKALPIQGIQSISFTISKNDSNIQELLDYLKQYCKISEDEENYIFTKSTRQYIDNLKVKKIRALVNLVNKVERASFYGQTEVKETELLKTLEGKRVLNAVRNHETYKIPQSRYQAAHKNFIASRIQKISSDPKNMYTAYTPIQVKSLHTAAAKFGNGQTQNIMTSMNPITRAIMQYQNMDGKEVIGIAAVGERVFMGLTYYFNEGLQHGDKLWQTYMKFNHTSHRIQNRHTGTPEFAIRTVKTDLNWSLLNSYLESEEETKQKICNYLTIERDVREEKKRKLLDEAKKIDDKEAREKRINEINDIFKGLFGNESELTQLQQVLRRNIWEKTEAIFKQNSELWTQADEQISILLSAATDNAKELILSSINAGQKMADMYIHLLILGYDINDIVSFMTSDSMQIITPLLSGNIFTNETVSAYRLKKICHKGIDCGADFRRKFAQEIMGLEVKKDGSETTDERTAKDVTNEEIAKYILSPSENKEWQIQKIKKLVLDYYKGSDKYKFEFSLLLDIAQQMSDKGVKYDDFMADLDELVSLQSQATETRNLGSLFGLAKGISPVYTDQVHRVFAIERIFNNSVKYFSFQHNNNTEVGLFYYDKNSKDNDKKAQEKYDDCVKQIVNNHGNWTNEDEIKRYIKRAVEYGLLVYSDEEQNYKPMFDFQRFMSDESYRDIATHIYDFIKKQYNIFDIVFRSDQYWQPMFGWYVGSKVSEIASVKSNIVTAIKRELQLRDAPFEDVEISRSLDYANELMILKWLRNRKEAITFIVPKGQYYYTKDFDKKKADKNMTFTLNSSESIRTFKLWMESYFIPKLSHEKERFKIGDEKYNPIPDNNLFLKMLQYGTDKGLIYKKLNFDMSGKVTSQYRAFELQAMLDAFNELDQTNPDTKIKTTDYFVLYNLFISKNNPGRDRFTNLFFGKINKKGNLLRDFMDFEATEDQKFKLNNPQGRDEIINYLIQNFQFSFEDVKLKLARTYSSRSYRHNGELIIMERDADGNITPKRRKTNYGRYSQYEDIKDNLALEFLNTDTKTSKTRLRNYNEDGIFLNLTADMSQEIGRMLASKDPSDIVNLLATMARRRQLILDYHCE